MVATLKANSLIPNEGLYYPAAIEQIKRSDEELRPVYEAFTNALEAIRDANRDKGEISITLYSAKGLTDELSFDKLVIQDNGIGFNDANFRRLLMFKDTRKGYLNKGSGRIQLIHFFDKCEFESTFKEGAIYRTRTFTLSKAKAYLEKNSIVFYRDTVDAETTDTGTKLTLMDVIDEEKDYYDKLTALELKENILDHYLVYLCSNKDKLPKISFHHHDQNGLIASDSIVASDIPPFDKTVRIKLQYSKFADDSNEILKTDTEEDFLLRSLKLDKHKLKRNGIRLTSKDEIVENPKVKLDCLSPEDNIDNNRYMFLLSGAYLDSKESDTRGEIEIVTAADFVKHRNMYSGKEILLDDIEETVNKKALSLYKEIVGKVDEHKQDVEKLKSMFLLNEATIDSMSFGVNDSEEKILARVYAADSEVTAKRDAEIKHKIDKLDELDPTSPTYVENLKEVIDDLVRQIPLSNRTALTQYVARRKLVLDLLDKILSKKLNVQNDGSRNNNEALLHSLIFQQGSEQSDQSDLWLVNEEFIYFSGTSNISLREIQIDGVKMLKESLTQEEEAYETSLGEVRSLKKPDVLLFPAEGKCIIVEFKDLETNVSSYLDQIHRYASLIRNLTKDEFSFDTFYGYLIGETVDGEDVIDHDARFEHSPHFDYVFRPAIPIRGKFGRTNASLYTEVLKYSTLLARANKRNEIFLEKILGSNSPQA